MTARYLFLSDHIPSLNFHDDINGGVYFKFEFPNKYTASVIKNDFSYGGKDGLWEIAVLDEQGIIVHDTPITSDVLGFIPEEKVSEILYAISDLPPR